MADTIICCGDVSGLLKVWDLTFCTVEYCSGEIDGSKSKILVFLVSIILCRTWGHEVIHKSNLCPLTNCDMANL